VRGQFLWLTACRTAYWMLMTLVPVPGVGPGHLDPENNLSAYVDRLLLTGHMWSQTKTWYPEGAISTLPAIATALFGILTGHLLRMRREPAEKVAWLFTGGNLLIFTGPVLSVWMPIYKKIWTTPYSVFMAGLATVCFALCSWFVDIQGWRRWSRPFAIYGMNAIAVYILPGVVARGLSLIKVGGVPLQKIIYSTRRAPGGPLHCIHAVRHRVLVHAVPGRLVHVPPQLVPAV
jgi:predicted acyltransferase